MREQEYIIKEDATQFRVYKEAIAQNTWQQKIHSPLPGERLATAAVRVLPSPIR